MRKFLAILLPVVVCFLVGFAGSRFQTEALTSWYPTLVKPALTPPNIVFPIAWSLLYLCMGISIGMVINSGGRVNRRLVWLFAAGLLLNFAWSIAFFYLRSPLAGMIDIVILDVLVVWYAVAAWKTSKAASALFIPYAAWLLFATYLNLFILIHN